MQFVRLIAALTCSVVVSSCSMTDGTSSGDSVPSTVMSRPMVDASLGLTPSLEGGSAGWCFATIYGSGGNNTICPGARTSTGPILVETCYGGAHSTNVLVLTRDDVVAVSVAGGAPIMTESNAALPVGLRSAAIELPGYRIVPKGFTVGYPWRPCPRVQPLDAKARKVNERGKSGSPLAVKLLMREWRPPKRPPSGVCLLGATRLPRETVAGEGSVTVRIKPIPQLIGHAFISCVETSYVYMKEHEIPAAVLLDAAHPGTTPPGLPGMKPLAGHPSIFEAPPSRFARRIHGAWLVVEEEDNIGPRVPVGLLERLHATIRLPAVTKIGV